MKKIKSLKIISPGSAADVDSDFHTEGRGKVLQYVIDKYGPENVSGIMTPTPFKAKNSFKTVGTLFDLSPAHADRISATMPESAENVALVDLVNPSSPNYGLGEAFRKMIDSPRIEDIVKKAIPLDGRLRGTGVHACGILISTEPIINTVPTQYVDKVGMPVSQWNYYTDEALGLIKMDFLGLDTVDIIQSTIEAVKKNKGIDIDINEIIHGDLDDQATLEIFQNAHTTGIFQFTNSGVKNMLLAVKPDNFNDLPAITALYRPGPMAMNAHNEYAERKQNPDLRVPVDPSFYGTEVENILSETLSLLVYQEQIMNISKRCAGFSSREADNLRKGIGKKNPQLIASMGEQFINGMIANGYQENAVRKLWDGIVGFGAYSFNKSHSVAYALTSYISAYLKAHYPVEFMASLIKQRLDKPEKLREILTELKRMNIPMEPASINESEYSVTASPQGDSVVFGLSGIKGLQDKIAVGIIEERNANGLFSDIDDFMRRMVKRGELTSSAIKVLANIGAFDCFGLSRKSIAENSDKYIKAVEEEKKTSNMTSLFSFANVDYDDSLVKLEKEDYPYYIQAKYEGDFTELFLSKHPLDKITQPEVNLDNEDLQVENLYAVFSKVTIKSKKGRKYGFVLVDNKVSRRELTLSDDLLLALDYGVAFKETKEPNEILKKLGLDPTNPADIGKIQKLNSLRPLPALEENIVYKIDIETPIFNSKGNKTFGRSKVVGIKPVQLSFDGRLAIPILCQNKELKDKYIARLKTNKGNNVVRLFFKDKTFIDVEDVQFLPGTTQSELSEIDKKG